MAIDYNAHYHPLLLKHVPEGARTALDVGCGTGQFARLLAGRGLDVEGIDGNAQVIEAAQAAGGGPRYRHTDAREDQLPESHYDFISCIASLHHMPFDMVLTLRKASPREASWRCWGSIRPGRCPTSSAPSPRSPSSRRTGC
ncbi:class I SAM-dependent methyltransferase [Streptomyces bathyalis]|uniref:class I SAM-dependent methyltransferase n=1 Tax=Streptomyces bathyalis TaxID=2710756 RepID=UPI0024839939|nr:class I SAM-dependent methyltransferase [Streptomyces bathyalis]